MNAGAPAVQAGTNLVPPRDLAMLQALEKKLLWLSTWTIHHANHLRPNRDGLKVGGHQASCASAVTLLTALYFRQLRPEDRIAVKPHASPVLHAAHYVMRRQSRAALEAFRAFGGAQSYPSRVKDKTDVDFSTGSVGLGVGATLFASLVQDFIRLRGLAPAQRTPGRLIALLGDAELDEGNVYEALLEGWKHDVRNLWWIVDYNRQSLDGVVSDALFRKIQSFFDTVGWKVVLLKYGTLLQAAFRRPGGERLRQWIDDCPNDLYAALTFQGGEAWRKRIGGDLSGVPGIAELLAEHDDAALARLMTNLAGHDMASILAAFAEAEGDDTPRCFVAYTIKGYNLPLAGHKDNHAGLLGPEQLTAYKRAAGVPDGAEWERFAHVDADPATLERFVAEAPYLRRPPAKWDFAPVLAMPEIRLPAAPKQSTQEGFGRIMTELGRAESEFARRILTTSPDVTVSTNLGGWVNHRNLFGRKERDDVFRQQKVGSTFKWIRSHDGQHVELGIAENNLFLLLTAAGLAEPLLGTRLIPIGTVYDPFIARGLDALNYGCYQNARFMLVGTPSGLALAPEGGAHQSFATPLIGLSQPGLTSFEPAFVDELLAIMRWGFDWMQRPEGNAVYLRLSTRTVVQPVRTMDRALAEAVVAGGYWLVEPRAGAELAIVAMGAVLPEAQAALAELAEDLPGAGLMVATSPELLHLDWRRRGRDSTVARLLSRLSPDAALVTVQDGHAATLSWLGAVAGHAIRALGVEGFGQSGDIPALFRAYGLDAPAIVDAAAAALLDRLHRAKT
ncbi:MAG: transketolase [Alphaproteobacteria bacterium]|nr:transketolase [Alphaproteobacteria bacterium]